MAVGVGDNQTSEKLADVRDNIVNLTSKDVPIAHVQIGESNSTAELSLLHEN